MSIIDGMIADNCPRGVPFLRMGDVGKLTRGNGLPKSDFVDTGVGAIHYGQIYTHYGTSAREVKSYVASESAARLTKVDPGDVVITNTSENLDDVGKAVAWLGNEQVVTGGHATVFKHDQNPEFIAYWLQSPSFQRQKRRLATGIKVIDVSAKQLESVRIPVPPLAVQEAIVGVLRKMEKLKLELESELKSELEHRSVQFAYYRDSLLSFENGPAVESVPMSEIGEFIRGRRFTKTDVVESGIPSIHYGEIYTHYGVSATVTKSEVREDLAGQLRYAHPNDVVFAAVGETVEDVAKAVAWMGDTPVAIHDDTFLFRSSLNPRFVAYFAQTASFHSQKNRHVARAKVKRVSGDGLGKILIPVPSPAEQERIVGILDAFDALVSDLVSGLPAEIEARRMQYEYYRDKLLTFEEATE